MHNCSFLDIIGNKERQLYSNKLSSNSVLIEIVNSVHCTHSPYKTEKESINKSPFNPARSK